MSTILITRVPDLDSIDAKEWDQLVEHSAAGTVFQQYGWQKTWWGVLGQKFEPLILEARTESGELVGIAPLTLETRTVLGRHLRIVRFAGYGSITYADFIVAEPHEEILRAFVNWLDEHHELWSSLQFKAILNTSPTLHDLPRFFKEKHYRIASRQNLEAPLLELGLDPEADKKLTHKQDMRNKLNRLKREGAVSFSRLSDSTAILEALPHFYAQHIRRREGLATPSEFLDEQQKKFFEELIRVLAPQGKLQLDILYFNEKPIAYHFFLVDVDPKRLILKIPTFDMDYAEFSPGMLMLKFELEASIEQAITELDFADGETSFKYRFANRIRSINSVYVFNNFVDYADIRLMWGAKAQLQKYRRKYPNLAFKVKRLGRKLHLTH